MYKIIRPLIFKASSDPETMHQVMMKLLHVTGRVPFLSAVQQQLFKFENDKLKQKVFGLEFNNPVGLAGGFDKQGEAIGGLSNLGFGFLEIGTVTQYGQPGNARPRIFRLPEDQAIINRMGFNNLGADVMAQNLADLNQAQQTAVLGINLGKSKMTELAFAVSDYLYSFSKLYNYGDYFVVNISSPNTAGLRQLQDKTYLADILMALVDHRSKQKIYKPILLKIVVDFELDAVREILEVCQQCEIDGVIASNTSIKRDGLKFNPQESGGLSGRPIQAKATALVGFIHEVAPNLKVVGVGGIFSAEDAYEKIKAGASLIQIYTGLVYEGPGVVRKINQGLVKLLARDGFNNITEAIGINNR